VAEWAAPTRPRPAPGDVGLHFPAPHSDQADPSRFHVRGVGLAGRDRATGQTEADHDLGGERVRVRVGPRPLLKAATPGAETTTTATTTTTIAPTTVTVNTRYQSVFDIREKTEEAGVIQCTAWAIRGPGDYDVESADGTDAVVFQIHENASQAQEAADLRAALVGGLAGVRTVPCLVPIGA